MFDSDPVYFIYNMSVLAYIDGIMYLGRAIMLANCAIVHVSSCTNGT